MNISEEEINNIERDLEIQMDTDFDEIGKMILEDIDLSNKTIEWLNDVLHKDMNIFFKHIMQRLGHKNYL